MVKSKNLKDKLKSEIVINEIDEFNDLVKGHSRLLNAIGRL